MLAIGIATAVASVTAAKRLTILRMANSLLFNDCQITGAGQQVPPRNCAFIIRLRSSAQIGAGLCGQRAESRIATFNILAAGFSGWLVY